jgi:hypothetical protein
MFRFLRGLSTRRRQAVLEAAARYDFAERTAARKRLLEAARTRAPA